MLKEGTWVLDAEFNGLTPDKIHCISCTQDGENIYSTTNYEEMRTFLLKAEKLIMHNGIRFDIPWLEKLLDIKITAKLIDTLALSWYIEPSWMKHGIETWGEFFNIPKPRVVDWENEPIEVYIHRCEEDVRINYLVWAHCFTKLLEIYSTSEGIYKLLDYLEFKMYCARLQEESGWKLDVKYCVESIDKLQKLKDEATEQLSKLMPPVIKYVDKTPPAKLRKKSGELSEHGRKWYDLLHEKGLPEDTQLVTVEQGRYVGNPASTQQVKAWLFSLGWVPETIKYEKEPDGTTREIPQINKENQKGGGICDSIKKLYPKEPGLEYLDGYYLIQHRLGILNSFLVNVDDGYLKAQIDGLANTLRFKHRTIVNLPRADRKYGEEVRGALICEDDELLCGSDMSGLEDRLKQHFIYPFDPDYVEEMNVPDYDPHLALALLGKAVTQKQVDDYKSGVDKSIKPIRDIFKNGNYAAQYGAYPPKIAITCNISLKEAKKLFSLYWEKNKAIKEVVETLEVKEVDGQLWQYNPVSCLWYSLRTRNDQFSTLVQGTGAYCFDTYLRFVLEERPQLSTTGAKETSFRLTGQFHDEWITVIKKNQKTEMHAIALRALRKTNNYLKLNRELDVGVQFGTRYSEIH